MLRSQTRLWSAEWIERYERGARAGLGREWTFDRRQLNTLEQAVEKFCKDKTRIADWVEKAAREFTRATKDEEPKHWSSYQPRGLLRWFNEDRPGYVGPRQSPPARPSAPVLKAKPLSAEEQAKADLAAAEFEKALTELGEKVRRVG